MSKRSSGKWIVAITGASGIKYAIRLLQVLAEHSEVNEVHVIVSEAAHRVLQEEENIKVSYSALNSQTLLGIESTKLKFFSPKDIAAPAASGSYVTDGMVVVPCSMSTLASIAHGVQQNLIHRAADVIIKENRKLILVPRETPLSQIHLENMLKLSRIGVTMAAAMPGFYHNPTTLSELIDMQCMKILDCMDLDNTLVSRWGSDKLKQNLLALSEQSESKRRALSEQSESKERALSESKERALSESKERALSESKERALSESKGIKV